MGDLISRKDARFLVKQIAKQYAAQNGVDDTTFALKTVFDEIDTIPAVDAVQVVRCCDCQHAIPLPEDRKPYYGDGVMECALGRGDPNKGRSVVYPDDFCSDGLLVDEAAKREDEGEKM